MPLEKQYTVPVELYGTETDPKMEYVQGDTNAYPLYIALQNRGSPYDLSDAGMVIVTCRSPTGAVTQGTAQIVDAPAGRLRYNIVGTELAEAGECIFSVSVCAGDKRLTWQDVRFTVRAQLDDGQAIPAQPAYTVLQDLILQVQDALGKVQQMEDGSFAVTDYDALENKPSIGGVTLAGDKNLGDLGLEPYSNFEIEAILNS